MAGFISDYWANKLLGQTFGATTAGAPGTLYAALFNVIPLSNGTGGTEVSGNAYARVAVTNNTSNFPTPTTGQSSNATAITFPTPTGSGWGTIVAGGWYDASTGGNLLFAGPFNPSRTGTAGLSFVIPIGGEICTLGPCS